MTTPDIWGREISTGAVHGHPVKVYANRPRAVFELLRDASRWNARTLLVFDDQRWSYRDFLQRVEAAGAVLRERGVEQGDHVAILAYNRPGWLIAFWALQRLGAVAVLGNALWNTSELSEILGPMKPSAVITDRDAEFGAANVIDIQDLEAVTETPEKLGQVSVAEDDAAMVMFSSGTTGVPKGVVMSNRSVIANIQNLLVLTGRLPDELDPERPGTISLLTVPLFHLSGIQISFSTMLSGGSIILHMGRFDAEAILRLVESEKVRSWGSVPTMVSRVIEHPRFAEFDTSALKSIPMGGSAVAPELRDKISRAFPQIKKSAGSLYGMTEAGGVLAAGSGADITARPGSVGRLLPVVEVRIEQPDSEGNGEILARTPSMTSGYFGSTDSLTDEHGWLRTGDLGRLDDDGFLYVTGRSKDIIIRGGENISAQHVEQALLQYRSVLECAVIPLPHADLGEEVAALVVLRDNANTSRAELQNFVAERIGKYEVPTRWWLRHEPLPVNATGKVLKREIAKTWQDVESL